MATLTKQNEDVVTPLNLNVLNQFWFFRFWQDCTFSFVRLDSFGSKTYFKSEAEYVKHVFVTNLYNSGYKDHASAIRDYETKPLPIRKDHNRECDYMLHFTALLGRKFNCANACRMWKEQRELYVAQCENSYEDSNKHHQVSSTSQIYPMPEVDEICSDLSLVYPKIIDMTKQEAIEKWDLADRVSAVFTKEEAMNKWNLVHKNQHLKDHSESQFENLPKGEAPVWSTCRRFDRVWLNKIVYSNAEKFGQEYFETLNDEDENPKNWKKIENIIIIPYYRSFEPPELIQNLRLETVKQEMTAVINHIRAQTPMKR